MFDAYLEALGSPRADKLVLIVSSGLLIAIPRHQKLKHHPAQGVISSPIIGRLSRAALPSLVCCLYLVSLKRSHQPSISPAQLSATLLFFAFPFCDPGCDRVFRRNVIVGLGAC